jgi:hypothetical protein
MAIGALHGRITKIVLEETGFSPRAREIAARANELVDERQGDTSSETNLHAMLGYDASNQMQTAEQAEDAVRNLLERAKNEILAVLAGRVAAIPTFHGMAPDYRHALVLLGRALHTAQDRLFHRFEPWPYRSIPDSLVSNPNYMICHGLRDVSFVSGLGYQPRYQPGQGWSYRVGGEFTIPSSQPLMPHVGVGGEVTLGPGGGASEWGAGLTLTWGAMPGEVRPQSARASFGLPGGINEYQMCSDADLGPRTWLDALEESRRFVEATKTAAGASWSSFVAYRPQ